jgi:hypothetical protein
MDYREDDDRGRRFRDEGAARGYERSDWQRRERDDRRRGGDRGFLERLVEELRSWFRDEDRRRSRDDREARARWGGGGRAWGTGSDDDVDRDWARQWGYVDPNEARERRGRASEGQQYDRYVGERYYEPRAGFGDPSGWGAEQRSGSSDRSRLGAMGPGPHAGRGPRGYRCSDERIREDVCDVLCDHGFIDASEVDVTVLNGEVTLIGVVRERPEKRMAEDAAEQVSGVREVHNQLRVSPGGSGQEPQGRPGDPRFRVA